MTKQEFEWVVRYMVKAYGDPSCYDDEDTPETLWFTCPHCGEPIYFDETGKEFNMISWICPHCAEDVDALPEEDEKLLYGDFEDSEEI